MFKAYLDKEKLSLGGVAAKVRTQKDKKKNVHF